MKSNTKIMNRCVNYFKRKKLREYLLDSENHYGVKWINFEFSSACNLRCKWCALDHDKKPQFMTEEILRSALDEIIGDKDFRIERIDLHNAGETLMHPRLRELLDIIAAKKEKLRAGTTIHLLTNGTLLNEKKARMILESNALDEIRISIDGGTREYYNEIRIGSDWDSVSDKVQGFLQLNNGRIKVGVICIVPPDRPLTTEWMDQDFRELFDKMDSIELRHPHNWDGSQELDVPLSEDPGPHDDICKLLIKNLVILPNGDVTVCCADLNSRGVIGNLNESSLADIFFAGQRLNMIELYAKNRKSAIELCKDCSGYFG